MTREIVQACSWPCCAAWFPVWHTLYSPTAYNCAKCFAAYARAAAGKQSANRSCQRDLCVSMPELQQAPLLTGRVHGWLASRPASACADCLAAHACDAACKHSCKQFAASPPQKSSSVWFCLSLRFDMSWCDDGQSAKQCLLTQNQQHCCIYATRDPSSY